MLLDCLVMRGEVATAGRAGRERLWDLARRVYPDDPVLPVDEALRRRDELRLVALGIARARGPECPVEPVDFGEAGERAVVEGVRGEWRVGPDLKVLLVGINPSLWSGWSGRHSAGPRTDCGAPCTRQASRPVG